MKPSFTFRPYQVGDEVAIQAEFLKVFPTYRALDTWYWIYHQNPDGAHIMLAWADNGELAAHYACTVHTVTWYEQAVQVGFIRDVFSSPAYRAFNQGRRGIFVQTIEAFVDAWTGTDQLVLLYGFPSERPFRLGRLFMRYQPFSDWPAYYYQLPQQPLQYTPIGLLHSPQQFNAAFDRLWTQRCKEYPFAINRSAAFLNWRFIEGPKKYWVWTISHFLSSEIAGYVIITQNKPKAHLVDFYFPQELQMSQSFWWQVIDQLRWLGVKTIMTWFSSYCPQIHLLKKLGFQTTGKFDAIIPVFRSFHPDLESQWVDQHFYYTMADSDLY